MQLSQWVRAAVNHADISAAELARRLTDRLGRAFDRAAVQKMMMSTATGRTKPRRVAADEMLAIAEITGYPAPADESLRRATGPSLEEPVAVDVPGLPVVGEVAAGAWLDPEEMDEPRAPQFFVPPDPRFPFASQRVWIVRGRSIERTAREGEALVCVLVDHSGIEPSDGDLVIAERRRDQGALIERTAKRLRIFRDRAELWPEYLDQALNVPLNLDEDSADDELEVRIIAVVKGVYRPMS